MGGSITIQEALLLSGALNGRFDTFLMGITIFATVFGIIVAIVIAFFAIRQLNVDREIRKYRDEIKNQKDTATEEVKKLRATLEGTSAWAEETKIKIEKELKKPLSGQTKKELEKLESEIETLKEEIAFRRGAISAAPSGLIRDTWGYSNLNDSLGGTYSIGQERCKKCKQFYSNTSSSYDITRPALGDDVLVNRCPHCGNIN